METLIKMIQEMHDDENLTEDEIVEAYNLDHQTVRDAINAPRT